ncbi:M23 family metallopeptidase [Sporolactobacillus vineae]|uniref:M23 family metallopeptidase n=1 Tax=Sporolactobacillus vineae TaxID=444463 RepID=UPI000287A686|nr:M23 family metallopeptidase [Sporolactobacillus vineae]
MNKLEALRQRHKERKSKMIESAGQPRPFQEPDRYSQTYNRPFGPEYRDAGQPKQPEKNRPMRSLAIRLTLAIILFGAAFWAENGHSPAMQPVRQSLVTAMTQEFQFTAVSSWYEQHFGNPMAFLPGLGNTGNSTSGTRNTSGTGSSSFAAPVSGQVATPYSSRTRGVTVKAPSHSEVKAFRDGLVVFVGNKKGTGRTVIIQHKGNDESWYGKLDQVDVKIYDEVKQGQKIGTTSAGKGGTFYFALKKGQKFIDPIQVMSFD